MSIEFSGEIWFWKGPAPFYFVTVPAEQCAELKEVSGFVTYGWGMIPVTAWIGGTEWKTSLWPKDGGYIVPIKDSVRKAEQVEEGDDVTVRLDVQGRKGVAVNNEENAVRETVRRPLPEPEW